MGRIENPKTHTEKSCGERLLTTIIENSNEETNLITREEYPRRTENLGLTLLKTFHRKRC